MLCCLVAGCEALPAKPDEATDSVVVDTSLPEHVAAGELRWHACRFRIAWPEGEPADWDIDLLLAHGVIAEWVQRYTYSMPLWRFHRRAARDAAGRQFSFLFYADALTASDVVQGIENHVLLKQAQASGTVESVSCNDVAHWSGADIAATSDTNWSPVVQRAWPHYIHGVSRLWLSLIEQAAAGELDAGMSFSHRLTVYAEANARITGVWTREGKHAFLHHLNAVFGYQPVLMNY